LKSHLDTRYQELEKRLEERESGTVNTRYISSTDPDAAIVRRIGDKPKLRYKTHRAVDGFREIITAVEVTPGDINEAHKMTSLIDAHEKNTKEQEEIVVADSHYGTKENFLLCHDKGITAHMPAIKDIATSTSSRKGIFHEERFVYNKESDTYTRPAGKLLKKKTIYEQRQNIEYAASSKDCRSCALKIQCTRAK
jgi:hypothetical protein